MKVLAGLFIASIINFVLVNWSYLNLNKFWSHRGPPEKPALASAWRRCTYLGTKILPSAFKAPLVKAPAARPVLNHNGMAWPTRLVTGHWEGRDWRDWRLPAPQTQSLKVCTWKVWHQPASNSWNMQQPNFYGSIHLTTLSTEMHLHFLWGFSGPLAHVFPRQFENLDLEPQGKTKLQTPLSSDVGVGSEFGRFCGGDAVNS